MLFLFREILRYINSTDFVISSYNSSHLRLNISPPQFKRQYDYVVGFHQKCVHIRTHSYIKGIRIKANMSQYTKVLL